jgi:integrase
MADRTLTYVRAAFNWHATRDDAFVPPIVRGMARTKNSERARRRILDDQEIRDVWTALDTAHVPPPFPRLVRTLLLSAQRRDEISTMRWEEIEGGNEPATWTIAADRYKTGLSSIVPLTAPIGKAAKARLHLLDDQREKTVQWVLEGKICPRHRDCRPT